MIKPVIRHNSDSNIECLEPMSCIIDKDDTLFLEFELIKEMNKALDAPTCWVGIFLDEYRNKPPKFDTIRSTIIEGCKLHIENDAITFKCENNEEFHEKFFKVFFGFVAESKKHSRFRFNIFFECESLPRMYSIQVMCGDVKDQDANSITFNANKMFCGSTKCQMEQ